MMAPKQRTQQEFYMRNNHNLHYNDCEDVMFTPQTGARKDVKTGTPYEQHSQNNNDFNLVFDTIFTKLKEEYETRKKQQPPQFPDDANKEDTDKDLDFIPWEEDKLLENRPRLSRRDDDVVFALYGEEETQEEEQLRGADYDALFTPPESEEFEVDFTPPIGETTRKRISQSETEECDVVFTPPIGERRKTISQPESEEFDVVFTPPTSKTTKNMLQLESEECDVVFTPRMDQTRKSIPQSRGSRGNTVFAKRKEEAMMPMQPQRWNDDCCDGILTQPKQEFSHSRRQPSDCDVIVTPQRKKTDSIPKQPQRHPSSLLDCVTQHRSNCSDGSGRRKDSYFDTLYQEEEQQQPADDYDMLFTPRKEEIAQEERYARDNSNPNVSFPLRGQSILRNLSQKVRDGDDDDCEWVCSLQREKN